MRLVITYRQSNRHTWATLLAALELAGLLEQVETLKVDWPEIPETFEKAHDGAAPVILACSLMTRDLSAARPALSECARLKRPDDLIICGGPHATARPSEVLALGIDAVMAGEGETAFVDLVRGLLSGSDWRAIANLCFFESGRLVRNASAPLIDLDSSRSIVRRLGLCAPMELTRGCRFGCRYCQTPRLWPGKERHRSIANAIELSANYKAFLHFITPNALGYRSLRAGEPNVGALVKLLEGVKARSRDLCVNFGAFPSEVRPEYVTDEVLGAIRPLVANRVIALGAQSGSDLVLRSIGRGHTVQDVYRAVEAILRNGFVPYVDVMFGLPGETDRDQAMTRRLVAELFRLNARVRAHAYMPLPGSPFEDKAPGALQPETRELLDQLAKTGAAEGDWREQTGPGLGNGTG